MVDGRWSIVVAVADAVASPYTAAAPPGSGGGSEEDANDDEDADAAEVDDE